MADRRFRASSFAVAGFAALSVLIAPAIVNAQDRPQRGAGERPAERGGFGGGERGGFGPGGGFGRSGQRPMAGFGWPGSFNYLLTPDYHVRDMAIIARELELDQSQRPIIEALLIDYRQAFTDAASELQHAARRVRRTMPFAGGSMEFNDEGGLRSFTARAMAGDRPARVTFEGPSNARVEDDGSVTVEAVSIAISLEPSADGPRSGTPNVVMMDQDGVVIEGDLPPEVQERLEQIRERMEQRRERMEERMRRWQERQDELEAAGELLDPSEVAAIAQEFHAKKEQLATRLAGDIELMLSPFQAEQWPQVQQTLRRLNLLSQAQLSGEQVDLNHVVRDMHLSQHELRELEPILAEYADDLDAALARRTDFLHEADVARFEAMHSGESERMLELADREADRRVAVRTVNDTYTQRIADTLAEANRDSFLAAVNERAFPMLAQPTMAQRFFRRAMQLDELDPDQRELIENMRSEHDRQLVELNERQRRVLRESEPQRQRRMIEMFQQMLSGEGRTEGPPRMVDFEVFRERMDLGRTYVNQLRSVVPQEVMPELHERGNRARWQGMGETFRTRGIELQTIEQ